MRIVKMILPVLFAALFITGAAAQGANPDTSMIPGLPSWASFLLQSGLAVYLVVWFTTKGYPQFLSQLETQQKLWRDERRQDSQDNTAALKDLYNAMHKDV